MSREATGGDDRHDDAGSGAAGRDGEGGDRHDGAATTAATDEGVRLSVVLPAYDERAALPGLIEEIEAVLSELPAYRPAEVIVVDDGSTDGTREWLRTAATEHDRLVGVLLAGNFGQSAALAAGLNHARGEVIVTMDADGQNDPADVPALLARIEEGYDCVSGWRRDREDPWHKTIPSAIQTPLARLTGPDIHDYVCGMKAYRREAARDLVLYGEAHRYVPSRLDRRGYRVDEVPIDHRPREAGRSKYGTGRLLRGSLDLVYHVFLNRYGDRPLHALGTVALLAAVGGVAGGGGLLVAVRAGVVGTPALLAAAVTAVGISLGVGLLGLGLVATLLIEARFREERPYRVAEVLGR